MRLASHRAPTPISPNAFFQPVQQALQGYAQGMNQQTARDDKLRLQSEEKAWREAQAARAQSNADRQFGATQSRFEQEMGLRQAQAGRQAEEHKLALEARRKQLEAQQLNEAAGIAQLIQSEQDPAAKQQMWQRFIASDPALAQRVGGLDPDTGAKAIVGLAAGYQKPTITDPEMREAELELKRAQAAKEQAEASGVSAIPGGFKDAKQLFDVEKGYRTEFMAATKDFRDTATAFEKVRMSSNNPSAAGDLSLIFNYMKMLDPGSVVRETEFRTAEQARAWMSKTEQSGIPIPGAVKQGIQKLSTGEFLLPEQRADFAAQAENVFKAARVSYDSIHKTYQDIAKGSNIDPDRAIPDFFPAPPPPDQALAEARAAIAQGRDRQLVIKRLIENGIDPKGL